MSVLTYDGGAAVVGAVVVVCDGDCSGFCVCVCVCRTTPEHVIQRYGVNAMSLR